MSEQSTGPLSGFVLVDKPKDMTSHDVVALARRRLSTRRVGHGGTLDPDATGVLVVALGPATRLLRFVSELEKSYVGEVVFGTATTTQDAAGEVVATYEMQLSAPSVNAAARRFVGTIDQIPPMVSAVKVKGRRLYELAREGIEIERAPRRIEIFSLELSPTSDPLVYGLCVTCSSGTYVRTLASDLGEALGGGAHLRGLRRVRVGPFLESDLCPLADLDESHVRPAVELVRHFGSVVVDDELEQKVRHGAPLALAQLEGECNDKTCVVSKSGELLAVYQREGTSARPLVVLTHPDPQMDRR